MNCPVKKFYEAFSQLDGDAMADCYHENVLFEDPAFGKLKGDRAKNMWRMLCESQRNKNFQLSYSNIISDGLNASADWEAKYVFSKTGRTVHNKIHATFKIDNHKIIWHLDDFNLNSWASQALGFKGWLFGGTGSFRKKLQSQTHSLLNKFEERHV